MAALRGDDERNRGKEQGAQVLRERVAVDEGGGRRGGLVVEVGEGAEVRTPMAITVIGGLLASTLLTLVVIPVVYSLLDRKRWPATTPVPAVQESLG